MFSSLLTWCSHSRSGIRSYLLFAAAPPEDVFQIQSIFVVRTGAVMLILCWCRDASSNSWNQENVFERLSLGQDKETTLQPHLTPCLLYMCNCKLCDQVIMWFKACVMSADSVIKNVSAWDKRNTHDANLPVWSWSCKEPSISLRLNFHAKALCVDDMLLVCDNSRGHTMWPPPSDNRKLPSCWQGALEGGRLVLALHQAGA